MSYNWVRSFPVPYWNLDFCEMPNAARSLLLIRRAFFRLQCCFIFKRFLFISRLASIEVKNYKNCWNNTMAALQVSLLLIALPCCWSYDCQQVKRCVHTNWSGWTECTKPCDGGFQVRRKEDSSCTNITYEMVEECDFLQNGLQEKRRCSEENCIQHGIYNRYYIIVFIGIVYSFFYISTSPQL